MVRLASLALLLLSLSCFADAQSSFTFQPVSTQGNYLWSAVGQTLRPIIAPITYVINYNSSDLDNQWAVAPAGSFFLWGTQPDMSISPDQGTTWTITSGTSASNSQMDARNHPANFPDSNGISYNAGCAHRTYFNRFYLMGIASSATGNFTQPQTLNYVTGSAVNMTTFFVWASNDGQVWNMVMNNASSYGMAQQRNPNNFPTWLPGAHYCVVDQKEIVYSISGSDIWGSNSLAVSWYKINSINYPTRQYGAMGGIYSPSPKSDIILMAGGTGANGLLNDVWQSADGGFTWTSLTAQAPWPARQEGVFAINSNGVIVLYGGDCGGGWCGVFSDAWVSVNGGSQWYLLNQQPGLNLTNTAAAFDMAGYLWLVTGQQGNQSAGNEYNWITTVQKSSLSFSTAALSTWSSTFTGGQSFSVSANSLTALNVGANPQGGNKTATPSLITPISAFSCALTTLPNTGNFNFTTQYDSGTYWGTMNVQIAPMPNPIVFENGWSGNSATADPVTGYWYGSSWSVAPAGSWLQWGTNSDVGLSTNLGQGWSVIAGTSDGGNAGLGDGVNDYDSNGGTSPNGGTLANSQWNAECAARNTNNRFYVIGNNGHNNNASFPFFAWASNDGIVWTQVMDTATSIAMTADVNTIMARCWVDMYDNVYFQGSTRIWMSSTFGRSFTPVTSTSYPTPRVGFSSIIYSPTPGTEVVITLGGSTNYNNASAGLSDVWTSTNYGVSWTLVTANAGWSPRYVPNVAMASNGVIVLHGGRINNNGAIGWGSDIWVSLNMGSTWYMLSSSSAAQLAYAGTVVDPFGYFYVSSGEGNGYSWQWAVYKSTLSLNNIAQWGPTQVPGMVIPSTLACTQGTAPVIFDFIPTAGSPGWNAVDQFIRVTNTPMTYVVSNDATYASDNQNQWGVAPAGSWVLFGTQPDVSISTNQGASWQILSGATSDNSHIDSRYIFPGFPGVSGEGQGNAGCGHRTSFNRWYLMGNQASYASSTTSPYFNWATGDGTVWYEVMDNATSYAMIARANTSYYGMVCGVDQKENVYSVGSVDTWVSTNLGVTFTKVTTTSYFPARQYFVGAIYSPSTTSDTMVILGGSNNQDVWQTVNGGVAWTQVTATVPWGVRGNLNFAISQNNVFVVMGGDCTPPANCGNGGTTSNGFAILSYNDVWISLTYGASWVQVQAATTAPPMSLSAVTFDAQGYMYLIAGQQPGYTWTNSQYKTTLSLTQISTWGPKLQSGAGALTVPAQFAGVTPGAFSLGGSTSLTTPSLITSISNFTCGARSGLQAYTTSLPLFDFVSFDAGNYWGTADIGLAAFPAPIVYEIPNTNSSYNQYWTGNQWAVAPAGSWLMWGSNQDVAVTTDAGTTWTNIAGGYIGYGLSNTSVYDYDNGQPNLQAGPWNTQCSHRNTFNNFYIIGNNQLGGSGGPTNPLWFAWSSPDGQTWTQVMDNSTSYAMAYAGINTGTCVVGMNDIVYYLGGSGMWQSANLGTTFSPVVPSGGAGAYLGVNQLGPGRQGMATVIFSPTPGVDQIVVLGGSGLYEGGSNDVWSTSDYGNTWNLVVLKAAWAPRQWANVAVGNNGVMVLYGGALYNGTQWVWFQDVWVSLNGGVLWQQLNAAPTSGLLAYAGVMVDPNGYVVVSSGLGNNWAWVSPVWKSTYSLYNIQQWLPSTNPTAIIPASLCPAAGTPGQPTFDMKPITGTPGWGAIDQFIRVTNEPINYVTGYNTTGDYQNQWAVAPAGSWLLWGTQPDVSISTNNGQTWTIISGTNDSNPHMDYRDIPSNFPGLNSAGGYNSETAGNAGCNHRTTFNRFYLFGNINSYNSPANNPYFAWATNDGQIWNQVMDNMTSLAMANRPLMSGHLCFVDQKENVYSVGGSDTWVSPNFAVSFTKVAASSYFTNRTNMVGAIYSPTTTQDVIFVMGGNGVKDGWQSSNGGQSWTQVTGSLPWGSRDNMNFQVSQNGVFVMVGGDCGGGWCGTYNDVWVSISQGATWFQINAGTTAPPLSLSGIVFDSQGYLYLIAGQGWFYSWQNSQYQSTQSFLNIATWAPTIVGGQRFTVPSSFSTAIQGYWSQGGNQSLTPSSIVPVSTLKCGAVAGLPTGTAALDYTNWYPQTTLWGTADIAVQKTVNPIVYQSTFASTDMAAQWAVAPTGSWVLWGSNPDVALSTNSGMNWTLIAGVSYLNLESPALNTYGFDGSGNAICAHRNTFNRMYVIGNNGKGQIGNNQPMPFAVYASSDGQVWSSVMDQASAMAMGTQNDTDQTFCYVDLNDNVYFVGGLSTWMSSNLGITWTKISGSANYFTPSRTDMGGALWTATPTSEMVILTGGRQDPVTFSLNDVWTSTNYGVTWQLASASAPWSVRQDPNIAVSQNGVIVLNGGQYYNGTGWLWLSDTWISFTNGATWQQLSAGASMMTPRSLSGLTFDSAGYLHISGGVGGGYNAWTWLPDNWRSTYSFNNIQQWYPTSVPAGALPIPSNFCPTSQPAALPSSSSSSSSSLSGGAIAGIVIGAVVGVALLLLICFVFSTRRGGKKATTYNQQPEHSQITRSEAPGVENNAAEHSEAGRATGAEHEGVEMAEVDDTA